MLPYCDLHTHSTCSDGKLTLQQLTDQARRCGIGVLAPTDHNVVSDLTALRRDNPDMILIDGTEASCRYVDLTGKVQQVHIVGLGFDPAHPAIRRLAALCNPDRTPYNQAQLDALEKIGIHIGTLEEMRLRWQGRQQLGTRQFAEDLVRFGYASSVQDAYDRILGYEGIARVKNQLKYPELEAVVKLILEGGGIPVLAHLPYYGMDDRDNHHLAGIFKELTGPDGAMETEYAEYPPAIREQLRWEYAQPLGLMESCASDFHGVGLNESDRLDHGFPREQFAPLLERLV